MRIGHVRPVVMPASLRKSSRRSASVHSAQALGAGWGDAPPLPRVCPPGKGEAGRPALPARELLVPAEEAARTRGARAPPADLPVCRVPEQS